LPKYAGRLDAACRILNDSLCSEPLIRPPKAGGDHLTAEKKPGRSWKDRPGNWTYPKNFRLRESEQTVLRELLPVS